MLSPQYPVVLVDLAGGERFTALTPPLSPVGTIINIRRWQVRRFDLAGLRALGTFGAPPTDVALLAGVIIQGLAFLYARLRDRQPVRLLGAMGFYLGAVIGTLVLVLLCHKSACP